MNADTSTKRKPGAGFFAAALLAFALAYPLGLGPACWLSSRGRIGHGIVSAVYRPLFLLSPSATVQMGSTRVLELLDWYSELYAKEGWTWGPHLRVYRDEDDEFAFGTITSWNFRRRGTEFF